MSIQLRAGDHSDQQVLEEPLHMLELIQALSLWRNSQQRIPGGGMEDLH